MSNNTTVTYGRRTSNGHKGIKIRTGQWSATIDDWKQDEWPGNFAGVHVHANLHGTGDAVISVQDHSEAGYQPFYAIQVGSGVGANLFLSPDQAETLLGLLERALDNDPLEGERILR
tara:strand:- start:809 stop:1159 length:351 start_codon:yes stop_codon:yes gene_type:complete